MTSRGGGAASGWLVVGGVVGGAEGTGALVVVGPGVVVVEFGRVLAVDVPGGGGGVAESVAVSPGPSSLALASEVRSTVWLLPVSMAMAVVPSAMMTGWGERR
jgi:hypothetical protein